MLRNRFSRIILFIVLFVAMANIGHTQSTLLVGYHPSEVAEISPLDFTWMLNAITETAARIIPGHPAALMHFDQQIETAMLRSRIERRAVMTAA